MKIPRGFILLILLVSAANADAQTSRRRPRTSSASSSIAVRAELAATLLESRKYSDAAREYRALLDHDQGNYSYRLGLAKSLAWGESWREAERELVVLARQRPNDPEIEKLEEQVRPNLQPSSYEASQWVRQRPYYQPYRLALARALVREHEPRAAIAVYDSLIAVNPSSTLVRELASAYSAASDRRAGVARLSQLVAAAPADTGYRLALIDLLVDDHQYAAALAQSDTVLSYARTSDVLVSRARIDIARDDLPSAERDLTAALALKPTPQAYLLLGDTYRWRGEYGRARAAYEYARTMQGGRAVTEAFAQLARDERSVLTFEPPSVADDGWQSSASFDGDNAGVHYSTVDFRRGFGIGPELVGSVGLDVRQLREEGAIAHNAAGSYAAAVGLSHEGITGPFYGRVGATVGIAVQPLAQTVPTGSLAFTGRYYAWSASLEFASAPAYTSLRTIASIVPLGEGSKPLTETGPALSLAGPIGPANIALGLRKVSISDNNQRTEKQAYVGLPLNTALSLVYWGSGIDFAKRSALYWSPQGYASNSVGLELAAHQLRGWSLLMRALPGVALTTEQPFVHNVVADPTEEKWRFQFTTGGELAYRKPGWETGIGFDWGRVANYTRTSLNFRVALVR